MVNNISAKIVADSINKQGNRITTMQVTFPRYILAELNTHRMFSRNSASSRAIPFVKMLESVETNPFIPIAWQRDHKGMQGTKYFDNEIINISKLFAENVNITEIAANKHLKDVWLHARDSAVRMAVELSDTGLTKQLCNRLLEPFMWHTVLITATEWENFFALRCPRYITPVGGKYEDGSPWIYRSKKDVIESHSNENNLKMMDGFTELDWLKLNTGQAEIHIMALAEAMWDAKNESVPKELEAGEWHIPFADEVDLKQLESVIKFESLNSDGTYASAHKYNVDATNRNMAKISAARIKIATAMCARVSYTVVGEEFKAPNYDNDIKLHDRLAESGHWSPFEHCAQAMTTEEILKLCVFHDEWVEYGVSGNFRGFIQYRKLFKNENIT